MYFILQNEKEQTLTTQVWLFEVSTIFLNFKLLGDRKILER